MSNDLIAMYDRLGWALTPCRAKRPLNGQWADDCLTPEAARLHVDAGGTVGLVLGATSGVVDVEGDDDDAEARIETLFQGRIPRTPTFQSKRGFHRLFRYDPRLERIGRAVVKIGGVEARIGANGKAVMSLVPPSTTDGHAREWLPGLSPADVQPARLPDHGVERLLPGPKHQTN